MAGKHELKLSADDWQLYSIAGREESAQRLNAAVADALALPTRQEALWAALAALRHEGNFGAADTEGVDTVRGLVAEVFGDW